MTRHVSPSAPVPPEQAPRPVAIPHPARWPVVGNLLQIPKTRMAQHFLEVARQHDGIFEIDFAGTRVPFVSSAELVAEVCDERRFRKVIRPPLSLLRGLAGDGLFTVHTDNPVWGQAHRILMPAFSQRAMRTYFDAMLDVAEQLCTRWEAHPDRDILVADDMTRLTLDTISLAGFGYRFRSFDSEELHPFLGAMVRVLGASMEKLTQFPLFSRSLKDNPAYQADIGQMNALVDEVIRARRAQPSPANDLLNLMLTATDPQTGESLSDINIRHQVITFLIAGHETTSGLLTFTLYFLLRNPHVLAQAYAEVDRVLPGDTRPEYRHIGQLDVLERVLKESLRLWPTAPAFTVAPYEDTLIGGRYRIAKDQTVSVTLPALHRDPAVWPDPERFDIDRFLPENEARLPPHAYKPFGNGQRACIGRQFALTEAKLALALILQRFALSDPHDYTLTIKETLTLKPDEFYIRARRRRPHERLLLQPATDARTGTDSPDATVAGGGEPFMVAYGSSLGSARDVAEELAAQAASLGFEARCVALDELAEDLPHTGKLIVVTATYNGYAPDSATAFETQANQQGFEGVTRPDLHYAVLGCGNTQWPDYQAFPSRVAQILADTGATRILPRGEADGNGDFDGAVEHWLKDLWEQLGESAGDHALPPPLALTFTDTASQRRSLLPAAAQRLTLLDNRELVKPAGDLPDFCARNHRTSTRALTLALPEGLTYQTGDHLALYPRNARELVQRAAALLGVAVTETVKLPEAGPAHLPAGQVVSVGQLLEGFIELQEPASRRDLRALASHTRCPHTRDRLEALSQDEERFRTEVSGQRLSILDLLEQNPACTLPLGAFVVLCPPLRPRLYSISSSALASPQQILLTAGTVQGPAWSGQGEFRGIASGYLEKLLPGDPVSAEIRTPKPAFAPPAETTAPMVLVSAGTGLAPFRGFLEERAQQAGQGHKTGPVLLFHGCRHPDHDLFYREELEHWAAAGIVTPAYAFSGLQGYSHRYVQDQLWDQREAVWDAISAGATVYVCGDGNRMATAVRERLLDIHQERTGSDRSTASGWLTTLMSRHRYRQDVFDSD